MKVISEFLNEEPIQAIPTVIIIALIYWFVRRSKHKRKLGDNFKEIRQKARMNEIIRLLFICWVAELVCCTMFPTGFWYGLNHLVIVHTDIKFRSWHFVPALWEHLIVYSGEYLSFSDLRKIILDFLLNIMLYIPFGLALPFIWKYASYVKTILIGFACTMLIEFMQAFISRDPSIDDVICNTIGAVFGYILYLKMKKIFPEFIEKCMVRVSK